MNVVCCQLDIDWEDKAANCAKAQVMLESAGVGEGSLVILPEMFATGFSMNVAGIAESHDELTQTFLAATAAEYRSWVLGGLVTCGPDGLGRNEAVVFSPEGREIARYCKMYPFTHAGEDEHYVPGREVVLFDCGGFQVAPFICYDLRFPEVFRLAMREGAQLFAVIANWPAARESHWPTLLQARAIENQAYVAGVNRCGQDPNRAFCGRSMIVDPKGRILVDAGSGECTVQARADLESLLAYRREFPVLGDAREDY